MAKVSVLSPEIQSIINQLARIYDFDIYQMKSLTFRVESGEAPTATVELYAKEVREDAQNAE